MALTDNCSRPLLNLRISITQRCNLKCSYCHREGEVKRANALAEKMTKEEIVRIAKTAVNLGISRVKLTGGEPLMREDVCDVVKGIAEIPGLRDLSMTTNAAHRRKLHHDEQAPEGSGGRGHLAAKDIWQDSHVQIQPGFTKSQSSADAH